MIGITLLRSGETSMWEERDKIRNVGLLNIVGMLELDLGIETGKSVTSSNLSLCALNSPLLGSVILPPSQVPEQSLMFPYVFLSYVSFVSNWFLPHIWTSLLCTVYHYISHPSLLFTQ